jgi:hypothetical protein
LSTFVKWTTFARFDFGIAENIFDWWGIQLDVEASNFFDSDKVLELAAASLQNMLQAPRSFEFAGPEKA